MHIFTISKTLGPKIIIVKRMMKDVFFFLFLLAVWVVSFGVAKQAILIHNELRVDWIFRGVVYHSYMTLFGQIPSYIDGVNFNIDQCSVNGTDPNKQKCPESNKENHQPVFPQWLTVLLLCLYLLFTNILLLNLLIAMFNYTFQQIQEHTDQIWKFQRHYLIEEYHGRPPAPPPLILFNHLHLFVKRVILHQPAGRQKQLKEKLEKNEEAALLSWETFLKENYLQHLQKQMKQSTEHKIRDTSDKVNAIIDMLELDQVIRTGSMENRLVSLEKQEQELASGLTSWRLFANPDVRYAEAGGVLNTVQQDEENMEGSDYGKRPRASLIGHAETVEMVRLMDEMDYDGERGAILHPNEHKIRIMDKLRRSLRRKFGVKRTASLLQKRWSDLKRKEKVRLWRICDELAGLGTSQRQSGRRRLRRSRPVSTPPPPASPEPTEVSDATQSPLEQPMSEFSPGSESPTVEETLYEETVMHLIPQQAEGEEEKEEYDVESDKVLPLNLSGSTPPAPPLPLQDKNIRLALDECRSQVRAVQLDLHSWAKLITETYKRTRMIHNSLDAIEKSLPSSRGAPNDK